MHRLAESRGWLRLRTAYLFFAVALVWMGCVYWEAFQYVTLFVMAPWTILLAAGNAARRKIRWNAFHILLFAAAGFYVMAAVRNANLSPRGLALVALGAVVTALAVRLSVHAGEKTLRRRLLAVGLILSAAALLALLATAVLEFFGKGGLLPWGAGQVVRRAARSTGYGTMLQRAQANTLKSLYRLIYACGAMLVAGIVPEDADAAWLRRESRALCLFIVALWLVYIAPAVASVFIGRPLGPEWLTRPLGIQTPGLVSDRIWAMQHPNSTAFTAVACALCAFYVMFIPGRRWLKGLMALAAVVCVMALAHTQSRTGDIALGLGLGALAFRWVWLRDGNRRRRALRGVLTGALALVLVIALVSVLYVADVYAATRMGAAAESNLPEVSRESAGEKAVETDGESGADQPGNLLEGLTESAHSKQAAVRVENALQDHHEEIADGVVVPRTVVAGMTNVFSTGRDLIWRDALNYLTHHPWDVLLGMGSGDILERLNAYNPDRYYTRFMHNGFLETLARGGAFMLLCLVAALCLLVKPAARALVEWDPMDPGSHVFAVLAGVLLLLPLVESVLFFDATMYNLLFFYAAGRVMRRDV